MQWILHQMKEHLKESWWMVLAGLVVFFVVFYYLGPLVSFTFALVLGTLLLAWVTAFLASANQGLAEVATRNELREALDAARKFIEIEPGLFLKALESESRSHPLLEAIDKLASYVNNLHDMDTLRDLQQFALKVDNKKIGSGALEGAKEKLTELQGRVVQEIGFMRENLRILPTRVYRYR